MQSAESDSDIIKQSWVRTTFQVWTLENFIERHFVTNRNYGSRIGIRRDSHLSMKEHYLLSFDWWRQKQREPNFWGDFCLDHPKLKVVLPNWWCILIAGDFSFWWKSNLVFFWPSHQQSNLTSWAWILLIFWIDWWFLIHIQPSNCKSSCDT